MFCNMCGKKVDEKSAFCTWCGAPIDRSAGTTGTAAEAPAEPQEKPVKPEKYYTSGQLALCLVTTGIMALAAGIFAALYFIQIL